MPVRKGVFNWGTTDPAGTSLRCGTMVGHILIRDSGCIFIDSPFVPGLLNAVTRSGKPEDVLLTSQNHTRASKYIKEKAGIPVYFPEQKQEAVESWELAAVKAIEDFETYRAGKVLGFEAFEFMYDYAILTDKKELFIGDNAVGDENGSVLESPGFLPLDPPNPTEDTTHKEFRDQSRNAFRKLVKKTGALSLLSSHGFDIIGNLQEKIKK